MRRRLPEAVARALRIALRGWQRLPAERLELLLGLLDEHVLLDLLARVELQPLRGDARELLPRLQPPLQRLLPLRCLCELRAQRRVLLDESGRRRASCGRLLACSRRLLRVDFGGAGTVAGHGGGHLCLLLRLALPRLLLIAGLLEEGTQGVEVAREAGLRVHERTLGLISTRGGRARLLLRPARTQLECLHLTLAALGDLLVAAALRTQRSHVVGQTLDAA